MKQETPDEPFVGAQYSSHDRLVDNLSFKKKKKDYFYFKLVYRLHLHLVDVQWTDGWTCGQMLLQNSSKPNS